MYITLAENGINRGYIGSFAGNAEDVDFGTYSGSSGSIHLTTYNAPRLTVANNGNVGIGTTVPQQLFSVAGGMNIDQGDNNSGTSGNMLSFGSASGEGIGSKRSSGINQYGLDFYTNNFQRMTITNGGNVGINMTNPGSKLEIRGALGFSSTTKKWEMNYDSTAGYFYIDEFGIGRRFFIKDGGNIGIGQSNPTVPLNFASTLGNKISLWGNNTNHYGMGVQSFLMQFYTAAATDDIAFGYGNSNAFTENMRIKGNGNLQVAGGIKMGNTSTTLAGMMRYNSGKFEGYDGTNWSSFDQLPSGTLVMSNSFYNPSLEALGYNYTAAVNNAVIMQPVTGVSANSWLNTSTAPGPRSGHTAVWTGTEMIVWGGTTQTTTGFPSNPTPTNTGTRYDPVDNVWIPTTTSGAPSARLNHSAVWTGTEMIIWGAVADNAPVKYNPTSNTWSTGTTSNAPAARSYYAAIWTGTEMIIWGGSESGSSVNTGAKYNPSSNTWTPVSTTNAPVPMTGPYAVWTGTQMLVWDDEVMAGGKYTSSSNTWTTMSAVNAPATSSSSVVWTGAEMIIWGGYDGGPVNTGARYNPSTNTWTAISTSGAPSARSSHDAVWTGTEMIVWGGYDGTNYLNTGGRYNPSTNTWTALTASGAPSARVNPNTVWTGNQMIVYGGYTISGTVLSGNYTTTPVASGGRYFPAALPSYTSSIETNGPLYLFSK